MGWIRKFSGSRGALEWDRIEPEVYEDPDVRGVSVRWLIGRSPETPNFAVRYFEIEPGRKTSLDTHAHDHGVFVLRGRGQVLLGEEVTEVGFGDTIYVSPYEIHQFTCVGEEPLGFLCVIPAPVRAHA
jgi:quercetin dioxygenase-like cupin family protein